MITLTRRIVSQLRSVFHRALGNAHAAPVIFIASKEGLIAKCAGADAAVEYHEPGERSDETICLPLTALNDFEGKSDDTVELTAATNGCVTAQWHDKNSPQLTVYDPVQPQSDDRFPASPAEFAENQPTILQAFTAASEVADPGATRYALGNVRLRGDDGSLAATDGRQLLRQGGYSFPWTGDALVARSKVLASKEFRGDHPVRVGKSDKWVTFCAGQWRVSLAIDQVGRYPRIEDVIPAADTARGVCRFSPGDTKFLAEQLPKLPADDDKDQFVTLDLNGQVIVRAKGEGDAKPTEVLLTGSSWSGKPTRLNVNWKQFTRAAKLGLTELQINGKESPVCWRDEKRIYVTAAVTADNCIKAADDAIRIESPAVAETAAPAQPIIRKKRKQLSESNANSSNAQPQTETIAPKPRVRKSKNGKQDLAALIDRAVKLRTSLHDLLHEAGELTKALKQQRRANRAVQQTLKQISSLKTLVA